MQSETEHRTSKPPSNHNNNKKKLKGHGTHETNHHSHRDYCTTATPAQQAANGGKVTPRPDYRGDS